MFTANLISRTVGITGTILIFGDCSHLVQKTQWLRIFTIILYKEKTEQRKCILNT